MIEYLRIENCTSYNSDKSKLVHLISKQDDKLYGHQLLDVRSEISNKRSLEFSFTTFAFESSEEMFNGI